VNSAAGIYLIWNSAVSRDTSPATAQRLVAIVVDTKTKAMAVDMVDVHRVDRPATHAVATVTCLVSKHPSHAAIVY